MGLNQLSSKIISVAIGVHKELGPGLLSQPMKNVCAMNFDLEKSVSRGRNHYQSLTKVIHWSVVTGWTSLLKMRLYWN